jgi:hypothetical protein
MRHIRKGLISLNEIIAMRQFTYSYIWLDIAFLCALAGLLIFRRKYMTFAVGAVMGIVYMIVDYGVFHLICHSRSIEGGSLFWTLLWMSVSYGFTNFVWIWLWLSKDDRLFEWSVLILSWWFCCPMISRVMPFGRDVITISRTTGEYHGYMAMILFVGYFAAIAYNLFQGDKRARINIAWILAIGVLVQFGWEAGLLLGGIRSALIESGERKILTLVVNSLLETNLGMPYVYIIFAALTARFTEQLKPRAVKLSLTERISENNYERAGWRLKAE